MLVVLVVLEVLVVLKVGSVSFSQKSRRCKNSTEPIFSSSFEIDVVKGTKVVKRAEQFPANFEEPE